MIPIEDFGRVAGVMGCKQRETGSVVRALPACGQISTWEMRQALLCPRFVVRCRGREMVGRGRSARRPDEVERRGSYR